MRTRKARTDQLYVISMCRKMGALVLAGAYTHLLRQWAAEDCLFHMVRSSLCVWLWHRKGDVDSKP